jgi:hypothetical protein
MMHAQEKRSWVTLGLFVGYVVLFLTIYLATHSGKAANIAFWLWIPVGIEPLSSWRKRKKKLIRMDERDRDIEIVANEVGFILGFWLLVTAVNVPIVMLDYDAVFQLPLWQLMAITNFFIFVPYAIRSVVIICSYRLGNELDAATD